MSNSLLKVENLHKSYWQLGQEIPVLKGVELEMRAGESLSVVGVSGIGKSTFLHCVGLIDSIDQGCISFGGESLSDPSNEKRALARRRAIGFVFQHHYLMGELTAVENVMIPLLILREDRAVAFKKASEWLERVGLGHRLHHRPSQLSGGEQQRVAIARSLVHNPQIIIADEPTGNLDPQTAQHVFDLLKSQCEHLKAILIMATHNRDLAEQLGRQCRLEKGKLV